MSSDDYIFGEVAAEAPPPPRDNNPPLSVSELSFALKRTLEDRFGHVRLRGEVSKVNRHASGHVYLTLKDDKSAIDGVIWKGQVRGLGIQPQAGLEVIVTGKITSYPARSSYQVVIETMEAAGAGALLAQLERLKTRLAGEGLFDAARKRPLPGMPATIGVITSPTGAVIRDILHRLSERWPCRVLVWPVVVQGDAACGQVSQAIRGFDALRPDGPIPRPDLLIVARGGGSVEDLWCFNEESLARAVADARIPIISAVGHETDTTLIDFVSDRRAPTPTAAAEMATPVLGDLRNGVADLARRLDRAGGRLLEDRRTRLRAVTRGLPARPEELVGLAQQRLDHAASRLDAGLARRVAASESRLATSLARLSPALLDRVLERRRHGLEGSGRRLVAAWTTRLLSHHHGLERLGTRLNPINIQHRLEQRQARLAATAHRLNRPLPQTLSLAGQRLQSLSRALASLNPTTPKPGFARIETTQGRMLTSAQALDAGDTVRIVFIDGAREAVIDGSASLKAATRPRGRPAPAATQGDLF